MITATYVRVTPGALYDINNDPILRVLQRMEDRGFKPVGIRKHSTVKEELYVVYFYKSPPVESIGLPP